MVSFWWVVVAALGGAYIGVLVIALCSANKDRDK